LARLSSRGAHRIIKDSSHQIELDKPQAVIDAVDEVLRELHTEAKPLRRSARLPWKLPLLTGTDSGRQLSVAHPTRK
jgi:hypothetical protein